MDGKLNKQIEKQKQNKQIDGWQIEKQIDYEIERQRDKYIDGWIEKEGYIDKQIG